MYFNSYNEINIKQFFKVKKAKNFNDPKEFTKIITFNSTSA